MTFYQAAAADRLLESHAPPAPVSKDLLPRPGLDDTSSERSSARLSFEVVENPGPVRQGRRGVGIVSTSKRSKRRSATSLRDLPPPAPPPTGPLPPTPTFSSEFETGRDSLEDLRLASDLFYSDDNRT
jgi:hypothetical protein